ncbi:MAG: putative toxin-antitoxin system toxin component, PIN family [Pseudomonadales bacterium]|nr:putative toxin-antitoxin system toxin component, PIN family [Pseudomonadales bacterium]
MRVFLDTNVWLSAIVFPGLCSELLTGIIESDHTLLTSALIHTETCDVIRRKFQRNNQSIALFEHIWHEAERVADCVDPIDDADARLISAAITAKAELFVTGDQRVLGWNPRGDMRIISPREAWGLLFRPEH